MKRVPSIAALLVALTISASPARAGDDAAVLLEQLRLE